MRDVTRILGNAIRARRIKLGLSQEELAFRSSLHRTYVADIERGARNPSIASVNKLAKALKLSLSDLFAPVRSPSGPPRDVRNGEAEQSWLAENLVEILLVEDNAEDAELAIRALEEYNFANHVHTVRNGAEALEFIFCVGAYARRRRRQGPQVILLDLGLPKVPGLEVLRRIRSDPSTRTIPVVVLTVSCLEKDIEECRRLGVKDYIVKPVGFENFSLTMPRLGLHWLLLNRSLRALSRP
jgi:two-component system response regulator